MNKKIQELDIKIIRLTTGEDIICSCIFDETVLVQDPMRVMINRVNDLGKTMLLMAPWLPMEIVSDNMAVLSYDDIITVISPKESFVEYYLNYVERFKDIVNNSEMTDPSFEELEDESEEDDEDSEFIEQMLSTISDSKKSTIH
jgi:hypothetical protein